MAAARRKRPNYGIDAATVVRNLILGGAAALVLAVVSYLLDWRPLTRMATGLTLGCLSGAGCMVWGSKVEKLRERDRLLDGLALRGDETVLDVGCGRGLLLIGGAKRLTTGKVVGVDIWQAEDLSGNRPEATLENARLEGVAERVEVKDGVTCPAEEPGIQTQVSFVAACRGGVFSAAAVRRSPDPLRKIVVGDPWPG
jgi:arsenite methyltransferase